jgi:CBS domain-containing protein
VFVVAEDEPLEDVALEIRRRGLATGIAVVDSKERFVGYAFNRDVQRRLDEFVQQSEQQIKTKREQLTSEYPELRRRL